MDISSAVVGILLVGLLFFVAIRSSGKNAGKWEQQENERRRQQARIVCPHCQQVGSVTVTQLRRRKGVSGGKATGALLTGGTSLLATGLSRMESLGT